MEHCGDEEKSLVLSHSFGVRRVAGNVSGFQEFLRGGHMYMFLSVAIWRIDLGFESHAARGDRYASLKAAGNDLAFQGYKKRFDMMTLLRLFRTIRPMPAGFREELQDVIRESSVKKNRDLLRRGMVCSDVYYVESGFLKFCFEPPRKKQMALFNAMDGMFCVDYQSFIKQRESLFDIIAVEDSRLYSIGYDEYIRLRDKYAEFRTFCEDVLVNCQGAMQAGLIAAYSKYPQHSPFNIGEYGK
jgi:hypothetical protein